MAEPQKLTHLASRSTRTEGPKLQVFTEAETAFRDLVEKVNATLYGGENWDAEPGRTGMLMGRLSGLLSRLSAERRRLN